MPRSGEVTVCPSLVCFSVGPPLSVVSISSPERSAFSVPSAFTTTKPPAQPMDPHRQMDSPGMGTLKSCCLGFCASRCTGRNAAPASANGVKLFSSVKRRSNCGTKGRSPCQLTGEASIFSWPLTWKPMSILNLPDEASPTKASESCAPRCRVALPGSVASTSLAALVVRRICTGDPEGCHPVSTPKPAKGCSW